MADDTFAQWSIVELLGHRRLGGYLTEVQLAGAGFLRLDIPAEPPATQFISPGSVYAITPTTQEIATAVARRSNMAPVARWELEPARTAEPTSGYEDEEPF